MPELPEVETIRASLAPGLEGRTFDQVSIFDPRLTRPEPPEVIAAELEGERVADVRRRGKYLIVGFESGRHLLVHLRMTGNVLHPAPEGYRDDPHVRAVVRLDDGSDVIYRDVRRFGTRISSSRATSTPTSRRGGWAGNRWNAGSPRRAWARPSPAAVRPSRRRCWISGPSQASETSTRTRRSGTPGSTR